MNSIDRNMLSRRFKLRGKRFISERLAKSPRINVHFAMTDHLHIRFAAQDFPVLALIDEAFNRAYGYVMDWFGCGSDNNMVFDLWMAPEVVDLQYMTCLPCDETFFCAPGVQSGMHVILFVSPQFCQQNADKDRLSGILAHEITHHVVRDISHASVFSMKRRENLDVPMWLEEGLCLFIESEFYPTIRKKRAEEIAKRSKWYDLDVLWNDLSACDDPETAYLQAYKETRKLIKTKGKEGIVRLLHQNRTHSVIWNDLPGKE